MWFKVDDKLHSHPKTAEAGPTAMGLWVTAGSWCGDQLTGGFVPGHMIRRLDPDHGEESAVRLVEVGLWRQVRNGKVTGWQFHDWDSYQPSREKVLGKRAATAARVAKYRAEKAAESANAQVSDGSVTPLRRRDSG